LFLNEFDAYTKEKKIPNNSNRIFIVHGQNEGMKFEIANFLIKLGLEPVILHEQVNKGDTIIEKFEKNSDVKFAIVILSDDDVGNSRNNKKMNPRARQNVVLEFGYFLAKLGRDKVAVVKNNENLEIPTDISGMIYIDYNKSWKLELAKELQAVGFAIDLSLL
jgi:predicted nucleotide-binding protein